MTTSFRYLSVSLCIASASFISGTVLVFAQAAAPAAAPYGANLTGAGAGTTNGAAAGPARHRVSEQKLLGVPNDYSAADMQQNNPLDAQRDGLLDDERMRVARPLDAAAAPAKGAARANLRAGPPQAGRPNALAGLTPEGAAKNTYADPYDTTGTNKHAVYRSPW